MFFDNSTRIVLNWDVYSSPDYYSTAYTYTYTFKGIPNNTFGSSYPKQGNAYAGFYAFLKSTDVKEYIYQHLTNPLIADTTYCVSYFISKADRANYSIKNFGVYFSVNTPSVNAMGYINALPQVLNNTTVVSDTINWVEMQGCFIAQGGESYITIGNFNSNLNTDTIYTGTTNPFSSGGSDNSYYYVDSVSLWQNNFPTFIKEEQKNEFVSVYPNPASDIINFKFKDATEKRKIELYDAIGDLVLSEDAPTQNSSLKTHHLQSGVYFYTIKQNGSILKQAKFVIMK